MDIREERVIKIKTKGCCGCEFIQGSYTCSLTGEDVYKAYNDRGFGDRCPGAKATLKALEAEV